MEGEKHKPKVMNEKMEALSRDTIRVTVDELRAESSCFPCAVTQSWTSDL